MESPDQLTHPVRRDPSSGLESSLMRYHIDVVFAGVLYSHARLVTAASALARPGAADVQSRGIATIDGGIIR